MRHSRFLPFFNCSFQNIPQQINSDYCRQSYSFAPFMPEIKSIVSNYCGTDKILNYTPIHVSQERVFQFQIGVLPFFSTLQIH